MTPYMIDGLLMDHPEPLAGFATDSACAAPQEPAPVLNAEEIDIELDEEDSE
jgi:hypothetical protein